MSSLNEGAPVAGLAASPVCASAAPAAPGFLCGRVLAVEADGRIDLVMGDERAWGRRALSCLIEPEAGDRVLVAPADGEIFVLAVLDRLLPDAMTLSAPAARKLVIAGPDVTVEAAGQLAVRGREARVEGEKVHILAHSFSLVGRLATFVAELVRTSAHRSEMVADEVALQAGERTTRVTGADVSQVGTHVQNVEQVNVETAHSTVMTAKEDLRFDGTRVTVG